VRVSIIVAYEAVDVALTRDKCSSLQDHPPQR
jgi:hypothetical protein